MNLRNWLVRLYPNSWRLRYGQEFDALLDECLHSPLDVLDIILGALDAHLQLASEVNWRIMNMVNKLRTTIWLVFAGYIGFVIGGLSLVGLVDDSPTVPLMKINLPLQATWTAIQIASVISLLAVVIGGAPLAMTFLKRAFTTSRRDLRLLLVPAGAFLITALYVLFMGSLASGWIHMRGVIQQVSLTNFPLGNKLLVGGFMLVFTLGALASAWAVWKILNHADDESTFTFLGRNTTLRLYGFAFLPAAIVALSMVLMLIATLVFGSLAYRAQPDWFTGNFGWLLTNTTLSFGITLVIMLTSSALAVSGLVRGYPEWKRLAKPA